MYHGAIGYCPATAIVHTCPSGEQVSEALAQGCHYLGEMDVAPA